MKKRGNHPCEIRARRRNGWEKRFDAEMMLRAEVGMAAAACGSLGFRCRTSRFSYYWGMGWAGEVGCKMTVQVFYSLRWWGFVGEWRCATGMVRHEYKCTIKANGTLHCSQWGEVDDSRVLNASNSKLLYNAQHKWSRWVFTPKLSQSTCQLSSIATPTVSKTPRAKKGAIKLTHFKLQTTPRPLPCLLSS